MCILQLTLEEDLKNSFSHLLLYSLYHKSKKQLKKEFGQHFDSTKFEDFCKEHGVTYERNVRIG